jgi:hypothetical protein
MSIQTPIDATRQMDKLAKAAAALGFEIVDVAGFLDLADSHANINVPPLMPLPPVPARSPMSMMRSASWLMR